MKVPFLAINFFLISLTLGAFAQSQSKLQVNTKKTNHSHLEQIPTTRNCGTMESLAAEMEKDPSLKQRMENLEKDLQLREQSLNNGTEKVSTLYRIPVVVHVVYSNAMENVSDAQIYSQIAVLNKDFRRQNPDVIQLPQAFSGLAADIEIEFCLASVDPNGVPTTGITRTSTTNNQGFSNQANDVKSNATGGKSPWNTSQYLNLWVCDLQGLLLGYAQFPGGSSSTDGVVIDYAYFGTTGTATAPFNLGRTATHEVGHYLNLRHIWGDATCGDDLVNDTPTQQASNSQCPSFPHVTCNNGPNGDLFMNYMDYVDDACMYMFTNGQKSRMVAALTGSRSGLTTNTNINCTLPAPALICDTIGNYPATSFLTVYRTTDISQPGIGYISGTNSWGDIGFAEKFTPLQPLKKIYGATVKFGYAYGFSSANVFVKLWRADFAGGKPGTVAASVPISIGQIVNDINGGLYSVVTFNNPVSVSSAYYIGIEFDNSVVDSIALLTTLVGQVSSGDAYEKLDNGSWYPFTDAVNSWGVDLSLAIKPIICIDYTGINESDMDLNDVKIYPNPSNGIYTLSTQLQSNEAIELNIFNSIGELVMSKKGELLNNGQLSFDLSMQAQGLYFVELKSETFSKVKKINLIH